MSSVSSTSSEASASDEAAEEASSRDLEQCQLPPHLQACLEDSASNSAAAAFEKISCIGEGAFGAVWIVQRSSDRAHFALKEVTRARLAASEENARRMWDERRALYAVSEARHESSETSDAGTAVSPALIGAVASFTTPDCISLVMDLVEGAPLSEHLRTIKQMPQATARWYAAEVAGALSWLHGAGWLYRDLKASNVMISAWNGRVRLVDFGFAKPEARATSVVGTLHAMAPEVIKCAWVDEALQGYGCAADWWSLGVLLFEMLAGAPPFGYCDDVHLEGRELLAKQEQSAEEGFPWPEAVATEECRHARAAVSAFLRVDPSLRLGASNGLEEIKAHDFFIRACGCPIDWAVVASDDAQGPPYDKSLGQTVERATTGLAAPRRPRRGLAGIPQVEDPDPFEGF